LAQRAFGLAPKSAEIAEILFDLETRLSHWQAAQDILGRWDRLGHPPQTKQSLLGYRATLGLAMAVETLQSSGDYGAAIKQARTALRHQPDHVPSLVLLARWLCEAGEKRALEKCLLAAWPRVQHPEFMPLWASLARSPKALQRYEWIEKLAAQAPMTQASHLALAEAALTAQLWAVARAQAESALMHGATPRILRLLETLDRAEGRQSGDGMKRTALAEAFDSVNLDPAWYCTDTGKVVADWTPHSPHSGRFDAIQWGIPVMTIAPNAPSSLSKLAL
jgi:HemY protein